ncbi:MAG: hypothetical protein KDD50_06600 [Bdellovibrionales bacterium]|nr:hypothetical protein [Bdellovibrionales bacterium]MCB0413983.1 hypothetical protein [Bdellovibrionales bacterium]
MAGKVKITQDGDISFSASDSIPTSVKKFRKSPEISAFYKFIYEHDLQREASEIIEYHCQKRKIGKSKGSRKAKK